MRETARAKTAYADYLAMGPGRSLEKLLAVYLQRRQGGGEATVPARRLRTLEQWSASFGWQARLLEIANREAREAEEKQRAHIRSIMETGYALPHERVKALQELGTVIFGEMLERSGRWLRDVKQIGSGETAQVIDIERFNAPGIEQFRGILDDVAKEMGQRVKRTELTGKDGGPIEVDETAGLTDRDRAMRIAAILESARQRAAEASLEGSGDEPNGDPE